MALLSQLWQFPTWSKLLDRDARILEIEWVPRTNQVTLKMYNEDAAKFPDSEFHDEGNDRLEFRFDEVRMQWTFEIGKPIERVKFSDKETKISFRCQ